MPAYNFKAEFADKVASGAKRCTIRPPRLRGKNPEVGKRISLYTGLRTKRVRKLLDPDPVVVRVQKITIDPMQHRVGWLFDDLRELNAPEWGVLHAHQVDEMAREDGFACERDFFHFFLHQYGPDQHEYLWIKWAPQEMPWEKKPE